MFRPTPSREDCICYQCSGHIHAGDNVYKLQKGRVVHSACWDARSNNKGNGGAGGDEKSQGGRSSGAGEQCANEENQGAPGERNLAAQEENAPGGSSSGGSGKWVPKVGDKVTRGPGFLPAYDKQDGWDHKGPLPVGVVTHHGRWWATVEWANGGVWDYDLTKHIIPAVEKKEKPAPKSGASKEWLEAMAADLKPFLGGEEQDKKIDDGIQALSDKLAALVEVAAQKSPAAPAPLVLEIHGDPGTAPVIIQGAHKQMPDLLELIRVRQHAYLWGAPGGGKSTAAHMAADALGLSYGYQALMPTTPESRVFGFMDAMGKPVETELSRRYRDGGVMVLEEVDNSSPMVQAALNTMLENGHASFPWGMVPKHKDFVLIATGNTCGRGGDRDHAERRAFDAAFADRFAFLRWGYDKALENAVALSIWTGAGPWVAWVEAVREHLAQNAPRVKATPRASFKGAALLAAGWAPDRVAESVVFRGCEEHVKEQALKECPLPKVKVQRAQVAAPLAPAPLAPAPIVEAVVVEETVTV